METGLDLLIALAFGSCEGTCWSITDAEIERLSGKALVGCNRRAGGVEAFDETGIWVPVSVDAVTSLSMSELLLVGSFVKNAGEIGKLDAEVRGSSEA